MGRTPEQTRNRFVCKDDLLRAIDHEQAFGQRVQRSADSAKNTVAAFRKDNMCADTSMPYTPVMHCKSGQDGSDVDPGCIIYDKCTVPTIWCSHNDPDYSNTEHGVPCFGMKAAFDFFKTL